MKRMSMYLKTIMGIAGFIISLTCIACTNESIVSPKPKQTVSTSGTKEQNKGGDTKNKQKEGNGEQTDYMDGADMQGRVVEFSDSGFQMSPTKVLEDESGGTIAMNDVPGMENPDELVTIDYAKDVTFEILTMDAETLTEASREKTDKETLKKQSEVLVFGQYQDEKHWTAEKIVLVRWKNL